MPQVLLARPPEKQLDRTSVSGMYSIHRQDFQFGAHGGCTVSPARVSFCKGTSLRAAATQPAPQASCLCEVPTRPGPRE